MGGVKYLLLDIGRALKMYFLNEACALVSV